MTQTFLLLYFITNQHQMTYQANAKGACCEIVTVKGIPET